MKQYRNISIACMIIVFLLVGIWVALAQEITVPAEVPLPQPALDKAVLTGLNFDITNQSVTISFDKGYLKDLKFVKVRSDSISFKNIPAVTKQKEEVDPITGLVKAIYDSVTGKPVMITVIPADPQYDKFIAILDPDGTKFQTIISEFVKKF